LQIKGGKRVEKLVAERRPLKSEADRAAYAFKRREVADKKREYENEENIKDIRWFEAFKAKRRERRISEITGKEVGGSHTHEEYERGRLMAETYKELDPDFLKLVPAYPTKKRDRRGKTDAKGRSVRDMKRVKPSPSRKKAA
jgi:hypothetical protein